MSYNISSDKFDNPLLKDLLKELIDFFDYFRMDFYVIGATARDIILRNVYGMAPERKTVDLDIAIAITDWNQFQIIEDNLIEREGFKKIGEQRQRFIFKDLYTLDIVPFGDVVNEDGKIYWPPDGAIAMSVWGFPEMADATICVEIDEEFTIHIASLSGLFMLKLIAWKDRHLSVSKDAHDLALLLSNYFEINSERVVDEHYDLFEVEKFDLITAGARLMARDIKRLMRKNEKTRGNLIGILKNEIELAEESRLINQLVESDTNLQYEQVLSCLEIMLKEWEA